MLGRDRLLARYIDGVARFCAETDAWRERGVDYTSPDRLRVVVSAPYARSYLRATDIELARSAGVAVDAKIRVHRHAVIMPGMLVAIRDRVYEVADTDSDALRTYVRLSSVTSDGVATLDPSTDDKTDIVVRRAQVGAARDTSAGKDVLQPQTTLVVRDCDYAGEKRLSYGGDSLVVVGTAGLGRWRRLTCRRVSGLR